MTDISPVVKANAELHKASFSHTPHDFTIKRNEQRNVETLALAEAFSEWINKLFEQDGRTVKGAEGLFDDVSDGVILCKILQKLGIACENPRDPPKNEFDIRDNRQKFQRACVRAKFLRIPSFDQDVSTGLVPTLLECAAIAQAQNERRHESATMPDAITKRTSAMTQSEAMKDALEGSGADPSAKIQSRTPNQPTAEAQASIDKSLSENTSTVTFTEVPTKRVTAASSDAGEGEMTRQRRSRTASEIPKQEKDQIVNMFIIGLIVLLLSFYFLLS